MIELIGLGSVSVATVGFEAYKIVKLQKELQHSMKSTVSSNSRGYTQNNPHKQRRIV